MAKYNNETIDLANFKKSITKMIATSEKSYNGKDSFSKGIHFSPYTKEEILDIIASGTPAQLREASLFYLYTSGFYRRFLIYYATLLKYTYLLIPHMRGNKKIEDKKYFQKYNDALEFIHFLDLKNMSKHVAIRVLSEGAYYGVLYDYGENGIVVQDLPSAYCRSRFKNQFNVDIVEMDVTYFDTIRDKETRVETLKAYPKTIRLGYNAYKNRNGDKWVMLEPGEGIYFTLVDERPFFSSILPAIIDFNEYREIEKAKDKQDLKALLVQKLPIEDGELVFDPEEAEEIHRGSVEMLKNNQYMDVLTTFADVTLENMESNRSVVTNNLQKIEGSIYSEAGVSKELFAAEGNTALSRSITNDTTLMLLLASKIANWVEYLVRAKFGDNNITFKLAALPISYYNESEMRKESLSLAQSGYSFLIPLLTFDLEQSDLVDLKNLEINALELNKIMIPLASSFTTSSGNPQDPEKDPQEVNKKPESQKSEKTIENINSES